MGLMASDIAIFQKDLEGPRRLLWDWDHDHYEDQSHTHYVGIFDDRRLSPHGSLTGSVIRILLGLLCLTAYELYAALPMGQKNFTR